MENRISELQELMSQEKDERGKVVINHPEVADQMIKFISQLPMHRRIKDIMILRLGSPFKNGRAMSHLAIAIHFGMKEADVVSLEAEGKLICADILKKVSLQEATEAFKHERSLENDVRSKLDDSKPKGPEDDTT